MIPFALFAAGCGAVLGRWLNVLVLIPASLLVFVITLVTGYVLGLSASNMFGAALILIACLQFGYLAGAALTSVRKSYRKRRSMLAVH